MFIMPDFWNVEITPSLFLKHLQHNHHPPHNYREGQKKVLKTQTLANVDNGNQLYPTKLFFRREVDSVGIWSFSYAPYITGVCVVVLCAGFRVYICVYSRFNFLLGIFFFNQTLAFHYQNDFI